MQKIVFITVNYKNTAMTEKFVASINDCMDYSNASIAIVDNLSTAKSLNKLNKICENSLVPINIIPSDKNLYYWGGASLAVEPISFGSSDSPDWIVISNNDIIFENKKFISQLVQMNTQKYPVIAPKITTSETGLNQNPHLINPLTFLHKIYYHVYYFHFITAKLVYKTGKLINKIIFGYKRNISKTPKMKIYAPHGSCIIFSKEYFLRGGYLDNGFSFYGEEFSVAEISREIGLPVTYIPELKVLHNEHASTSSRNWLTAYNQSKETYRYLRKKYSFK